MYVIMEGTIVLSLKTLNATRRVGTCGPAKWWAKKQFWTKPPIDTPISAVAETNITFLELDAKT